MASGGHIRLLVCRLLHHGRLRDLRDGTSLFHYSLEILVCVCVCVFFFSFAFVTCAHLVLDTCRH
jgi:hypothetical protein